MQPIVMGILNLTPDSFYDGGKFNKLELALQQARQMVDNGASIIDVGGESTRPQASPVGVQEELDRVLPVIEKIAAELDVVVSIDSAKPEVMQAAIKAGAGMINDVTALKYPKSLKLVAEYKVPVCLMHMQGEPRAMQDAPEYSDVVGEIKNFFRDKIATCINAGINKNKIIIDPGFGFGKSLQHNLKILNNLAEFKELECDILVGISRKSMLGDILNVPVGERLAGGLAAAVLAYNNGAKIIRTHDVLPTKQALQVAMSCKNG